MRLTIKERIEIKRFREALEWIAAWGSAKDAQVARLALYPLPKKKDGED